MTETIHKDDLYVYNLPEKIVNSLELIYFDSSTLREVDIQRVDESQKEQRKQAINNANECSVCKIILLSQDDKKFHYKSDFHRLNLKRSVSGLDPLTEVEFDKLVEEESIESLSGSESEDEDTNEEDMSKLDTIFERFSVKDLNESEESSVSYLNTKSPFILLKSPLVSDSRAFGAYKSLLTETQLLKSPMETIKSWSQAPITTGKSALFMIGGGHFAGAIISHVPKNIHGNVNSKGTKQEQAVNVLISKTFHRYTTRRKQGGSQSASDNARGKANSAGSSIRRYNEQALIKEVRDLLVSWKSQLDECTSIFIRANGASNKKILVGYEGSVLKNDDNRIKTFPFTTKRATTSELRKAWVQLSYLNIVDLPRVIEQKKPSTKKTPEPQQTNPQEELSENDKHSIELVNLLKKQKAPMLINYLKKNKLSFNFRLTPESKYFNYPTLLHYSSSHNLNHMVQILLINLKADPTIQNKYGKTPYEIANDSSTKKAFQISRYKLGEDYMNWNLSKVGPAKSKEEFEREEQMEQERIKEDKRNLIKEELSKRTELELKKPRYTSSGKLGDFSINQHNEINELSEEQKMKLMREQRARAAEARFRKLQDK